MRQVSVTEASHKLEELLQEAVRDRQEIVLAGKEGKAVMISQEEWEAAKETLIILRDKKALRALLEGQETRAKGQRPQGKDIEQVFYDLEN